MAQLHVISSLKAEGPEVVHRDDVYNQRLSNLY